MDPTQASPEGQPGPSGPSGPDSSPFEASRDTVAGPGSTPFEGSRDTTAGPTSPPLEGSGGTGAGADSGPGESASDAAGSSADGTDRPSPTAGLPAWIAIIAAGSVLSTLLGHPEASLFSAGAGMFVLAQASDAAAALAAYRHWVRDSLPGDGVPGRIFRLLVRGIVPAMGALVYLMLGSYAWDLGDAPRHRLAAVWSYGAAAISLLLVARPVADRVTTLLFGRDSITRTRRLAARLIVLALLLPVPGQALLPEILDEMRGQGTPLVDAGALVTQLFGEIAVALAGVGWLVRRRWPATAERLGLAAVRPSHAGIIVAGILAAIAINAGMESLEHAALPQLWRQDQEVTRLIVGEMAVWTALLLGLSAGLGEEIVLRGALQPRLGVVLTSVVFACGHVQYSWFGMLTIALLGVMLGLVRQRTNTSVVIVVHGLYDIVAVLTAQ